MSFQPQKLLEWQFPEKRQQYTRRDAVLYALGIGMPIGSGGNSDLQYVLQEKLSVLPTFAVTLASPGMWVKEPELAIDWTKLLHAGHAARFETPLPPEGEVVSRARIKALFDRGPDKGAVCVLEREVRDADNDTLYCIIDQTLLLRGNGGFGGQEPPRNTPATVPDRVPDLREAIATSPRAALIYRLSGDLNPLHTDYSVARKAGFERPILHGLASYGLAAAVLIQRFGASAPEALKALELRFSGIVYPGDILEFRAWKSGGVIHFQAFAGDRKVLDQGRAEIA